MPTLPNSQHELKRRFIKAVQGNKILALVVVLVLGYFAKTLVFSGKTTVQEIETSWNDQYTVVVAASGQIRAGQEMFMTLRRGGQLDEVNFKQGDAVKKGQIILVVDAANNRANLTRALSKFQYASAEFGRNKSLLASAAATRQAYEDALNQVNVARSDLEEAKQKLEDSIVRAPADGIVSLIAFKVGDYIPDGSRVVVVEDRTSYEITVRLPIERQNDLPSKTEVSIEPNQLGSNASKQQVEVEIESLAALASAISRDFDARLKFMQVPAGYEVKQQVKVTIPIKTYEQVAALRPQYVFDIQNNPKVLTVNDDNVLAWKSVEIVDLGQDAVYIRGIDKNVKVVVPTSNAHIEQSIGKHVAVKDKSTMKNL